MNTTNIFCIVGKTGSGKSEYYRRLLFDHPFTKILDISPLVYGTTRNKRLNEIEGIDYYFHTKEQYDRIDKDDLVEFRSYYKSDEGVVYYFTKNIYFEKTGNIICAASPYQYESYRTWCDKENIKTPGKYKLYLIIIDASVYNRVTRLIKRHNNNEDAIYEICRRILEEKSEFENVFSRIPELIDPLSNPSVCFIDNNNDGEGAIEENIKRIKRFILAKCESK